MTDLDLRIWIEIVFGASMDRAIDRLVSRGWRWR